MARDRARRDARIGDLESAEGFLQGVQVSVVRDASAIASSMARGGGV